MRLHVDFFEFIDRYPGINLCGVQFGMTQHLLDITDIGPTLKHQRGHAVTKQMAGPLFIDVRGVDILVYHFSQVMGLHGSALGV